MCPKRVVCSPPGYGWQYGYLMYGRVADALAYMPVGDAPDRWIANGNAFTSNQICANYQDLNGGALVTDTLASSWNATRVSCCNIVPMGRNWNFYNLGVFNNTGTNHRPPWAGGDAWYPPVSASCAVSALLFCAVVTLAAHAVFYDKWQHAVSSGLWLGITVECEGQPAVLVGRHAIQVRR